MEVSKCARSAFTVTFAIEILGIDVFHDCNEGWLDLTPGPVQGLKLQYQLAPGQNFDVDILIWPHIAKIWCGLNSGWVRTWLFMQKRWLAFSIRHAFPVRVMTFKNYIATVIPSIGLGSISTNAKNDKNIEAYLPKLLFGERRQFGPVLELEETLIQFMQKLIWNLVMDYIPPSYFDGPIDIPHPVTDKRHQDAVLEHIEKSILNCKPINESSKPEEQNKSKTDAKANNTKNKNKCNAELNKFEIKLSGDAIIAGTGRILRFDEIGMKPQGLGEIIVLIASACLPAHDDNPIIFINIGKLVDIPIDAFKQRGISHIYTKWILNDEEHSTELKEINTSNIEINFNDHHAVVLPYNMASEIITALSENVYKVEVRGIRPSPSINQEPFFFGYAKEDRDYIKSGPPKLPNLDRDIIIAITKIDIRLLKSVNSIIRGEYPLYPPEVAVKSLKRETICTNDINAIRMLLKPELVVPAAVILEAQMTLELSMGVVGCKSHKMSKYYSRLYCLIKDSEAAITILRDISEINEQVVVLGIREDMLTGFALDTGDIALLYIEGPRDGQILHIWEKTEDYYPEIKPIFSTSAKYHCRLYPELLMTAMPFHVLKMFVPLSVLLACPPIYVRPTLPLPARTAVLKIGNLIASKLLTMPNAYKMPTMMELQSFRLELCVTPRPPPINKPLTGKSQAQNNLALKSNNWLKSSSLLRASRVNGGLRSPSTTTDSAKKGSTICEL